MDNPLFEQRRLLLRCLGAAGFAFLPGCRSAFSGLPHTGDLTSAQSAVLRDSAIKSMRLADLSPSWFTSANWDNGHYAPWTDYLVGKASESEFSKSCAQISDYCLRDVWDLTRDGPRPIDWLHGRPLNWNGIHALSLRFFRTGEAIYLRKWLAVVRDFALSQNRHSQSSESAPISQGNAAALLESAMAWGGIFTAFTVLAKGAGRDSVGRAASPFAAIADVPDQSALDLFAPEILLDIVRGFAAGDATNLIRYYGPAAYIPNQRVYGLEALAYLLAFFPALPESTSLSPQVHSALNDAFTRYRHRDGGQLEQSFNYARGTVFAAERMEKLAFAAPVPWKDEARSTVEGWQRMAAALATPLGGLPQVGNTVWGKEEATAIPAKFAATSMAFPYSGYYVMRSSWNKDAGYLFFFYRRAARGHSMAGCNSIQLGAYGRQLLIAGGSSNYKGAALKFPNSPAYLAEESSYKTNTILVDGRFQNGGSLQGLPFGADGKPDTTATPATPVLSRWHTSTHFDLAEGLFAEGYRGGLDDPAASLVTGVSHRRQVVFIRELMVWLVVDIMLTEASHRYTQVWKFSAPNNGLAIPGFSKEQIVANPAEKAIRTVDTSTDAVNVSLRQFGVADVAYRSYFAEGAFGYFGPGPLMEAAPAGDTHVEWAGAGNQVLVTVVAPHRGMVSPVTNAVDLSVSAGLAGCRLEMAGGGRLTVVASAAPQKLSAGSKTVPSASLLILLEQEGRPACGLMLADEGSHEFDGGATTPIHVPKGFRWMQDAAGTLRPDYGLIGKDSPAPPSASTEDSKACT